MRTRASRQAWALLAVRKVRTCSTVTPALAGRRCSRTVTSRSQSATVACWPAAAPAAPVPGCGAGVCAKALVAISAVEPRRAAAKAEWKRVISESPRLRIMEGRHNARLPFDALHGSASDEAAGDASVTADQCLRLSA